MDLIWTGSLKADPGAEIRHGRRDRQLAEIAGEFRGIVAARLAVARLGYGPRSPAPPARRRAARDGKRQGRWLTAWSEASS